MFLNSALFEYYPGASHLVATSLSETKIANLKRQIVLVERDLLKHEAFMCAKL